MRLGFEKLEKEIHKMSVRKGEEEKKKKKKKERKRKTRFPPDCQDVIWGTQRNDLYDSERKNISGEVLTMFWELTMCQTLAPSL